MKLECTAYKDQENIPLVHAHKSVAGGRNISPAFTWSDPPITTRSFALSVVDPHPVAKNWVHWCLYDIPLRERGLSEGSSRTDRLPKGAKEVRNSFGELGYGGPAPPRGSGPHPYVATIFALNVSTVHLPPDASLRQFENAIEGKVIEAAVVTGYFER